MKTLQLKLDARNPVYRLSGYKATTDYWREMLVVVNSLLKTTVQYKATVKQCKAGADIIIEYDVFPSTKEHTAVEWSEFVMAVNHVLWALDSVPSDKSVEIVMEVLNDLYYEWRDKALDTLKGDDLSTYLRITD